MCSLIFHVVNPPGEQVTSLCLVSLSGSEAQESRSARFLGGSSIGRRMIPVIAFHGLTCEPGC